MEFSGKFDTHFFQTIQSFTNDMFTVFGTLYVQTEPEYIKQGIIPQEIIMIENPSDVLKIQTRFHASNKQIASIYWQRGQRIF